MKKKVSWGDAWLVLRTGSIADEITAQIIHADVMAAYAPTDKGLWRQFAQICAITESSGGLSFKPETMPESNSFERRKAYADFTGWPGKVFDKLMDTYNAVNADSSVIVEDVSEGDQKKA